MKYNNETKKWESPYWHPAVTTDSVVFGFDGEDLNLLLIQRGGEPYAGMWALPGGFLDVEKDRLLPIPQSENLRKKLS